MTLAELIAALDARGVALSARLVVDAPAGVLTPELREALAEHKPLLLQRVTREMAWGELAARRWGPAVGDPTPGVVVP
jgi:TubC N-terminal docking domain